MDYQATLEHLYRLERFGIKLGLENIRRLLSLLVDPHRALKVGMGGRMDATNVVDGLVSVITRVDLEHTEQLGKTVERIAREKAGIIKRSSRAVTVDQAALPVIEARCREVHAPLTVLERDVHAERIAGDLRGQRVRVRGSFGSLELGTPLLGTFQVENLRLAVAALVEMRPAGFTIPEEAIQIGRAHV